MTAEKFSRESDLFKGLKTLSDSSFPKRCGNCGRTFKNTEQYLKETDKLMDSSGIKASYDEDDQPILEVYRNCVCGSTLMDFFSDRRDLSEKGQKRRIIFEKILTFLEQKGIAVETAREELIKFMRSGESEMLEKFGIKGQIHKI